jgi:hypothetical protein
MNMVRFLQDIFVTEKGLLGTCHCGVLEEYCCFIVRETQKVASRGNDEERHFNSLNAELYPICKSQFAELFCGVFKFCA